MEVWAQIERADVWQVTKYAYFRVPSRAIPIYLSLLVLLWSIFSGVISGMVKSPLAFKITAGLISAVIIAAPLILLLYFLVRWLTLYRAAQTPGILGEHVYTISPTGLREKTGVSDGLTSWPGVTNIVAAKEHLYFFVGPSLVHVIPRRAFRDPGGMTAFFDLARSYWKDASTNPQTAPD